MNRITTLFSAALLATALAMFSPASPVSADTDPCVGAGSATVNPGLYYPGGKYTASAGFNFNLTTGPGCTRKTTLTASGTVSGYCGLSVGVGVANGGHDFVFVGIGGDLVITGELVGDAVAIPDAVNGESCTPVAGNDGANRFIVAGQVTKDDTPLNPGPAPQLPCVTHC